MKKTHPRRNIPSEFTDQSDSEGMTSMLRCRLVISLHEQRAMGKSIRQIARDSNLARNTVRKYLRAEGLPERKERSKRCSKLYPFKPAFDQLMADGVYNAEVLWERIREQGYSGSRTLVKDYVKPHRPPRQAPAVQRYETKPGNQVQVDWGIAHYIDEQGIVHNAPVFVMTLGYSRATYIEFTRRCDIRSFMRCLINAMEYFGGVPKACRVHRPQTKSKVDRTVRFVKENFLPCRTFVDLGDLNAQARQWYDAKNRRIHGTTGERPLDRLPQEEQKSLPGEDTLAAFRFESRRVSQVTVPFYKFVL